jgi:hypothetical protein
VAPIFPDTRKPYRKKVITWGKDNGEKRPEERPASLHQRERPGKGPIASRSGERSAWDYPQRVSQLRGGGKVARRPIGVLHASLDVFDPFRVSLFLLNLSEVRPRPAPADQEGVKRLSGCVSPRVQAPRDPRVISVIRVRPLPAAEQTIRSFHQSFTETGVAAFQCWDYGVLKGQTSCQR